MDSLIGVFFSSVDHFFFSELTFHDKFLGWIIIYNKQTSKKIFGRDTVYARTSNNKHDWTLIKYECFTSQWRHFGHVRSLPSKTIM